MQTGIGQKEKNAPCVMKVDKRRLELVRSSLHERAVHRKVLVALEFAKVQHDNLLALLLLPQLDVRRQAPVALREERSGPGLRGAQVGHEVRRRGG